MLIQSYSHNVLMKYFDDTHIHKQEHAKNCYGTDGLSYVINNKCQFDGHCTGKCIQSC